MFTKKKDILKWWRKFMSNTWLSPEIEDYLLMVGIPPTRWLNVEEITRICEENGLFYRLPEIPIAVGSYPGWICETEAPFRRGCIGFFIGVNFSLRPRIENNHFGIRARIATPEDLLEPGHGRFLDNINLGRKLASILADYPGTSHLDDMPKVVEIPIPKWAQLSRNQCAFCFVEECHPLIQPYYTNLTHVLDSV